MLVATCLRRQSIALASRFLTLPKTYFTSDFGLRKDKNQFLLPPAEFSAVGRAICLVKMTRRNSNKVSIYHGQFHNFLIAYRTSDCN